MRSKQHALASNAKEETIKNISQPQNDAIFIQLKDTNRKYSCCGVALTDILNIHRRWDSSLKREEKIGG